MDRIIADCGDTLRIVADAETGGVTQFTLFGEDLFAPADPATVEIAVNDKPLRVRSMAAERVRQLKSVKEPPALEALQGKHTGEMVADHFVNQYCGFGIDVTRHLRAQPHLNAVHLCYHLTRARTRPPTLVPGPGGPAIEARLLADTITVPRWNWKFWGEKTRMWHLSLQGSGPKGPGGHAGYNNGPVKDVKEGLANIWRRQYPGVMGVQGAIYYNKETEHWLAFVCRRPQTGYVLDLEQAGDGIAYSFTLHDEWACDQSVTLPEIVLHYGRSAAEMEDFVHRHLTQYFHDAPAWNSRTTWFGVGLWHAYTSWDDLFDKAERVLDGGAANGIGPYNMLHHWSRAMGGTTPYGYEPDPAMGRRDVFEARCRRLKERGVPLGIWMSHSGLGPGAEIDEDWFIRGVDGKTTASWGSERTPALLCTNPGHPGYIEYTKRWIKYYIELGFRWFFFDCGGWAFPPDYKPRDFMRHPGDTGVMAVKFFDEVVAYAESLDPGVLFSLEGASSDFPIHAPAINSNPIDSEDGLGPRDYVLGLNTSGRRRIMVDQGAQLYPASGRCSLPFAHPEGLSFDAWFDWVAENEMYRKIAAFVKEYGIYDGIALPRCVSLIDDKLFLPDVYKGEPVCLPEGYEKYTQLVHPVTGETYEKTPEGFVGPGTGMYELR